MPDPHEAAVMADAPVPGAGDDGLELPCGELVDPTRSIWACASTTVPAAIPMPS